MNTKIPINKALYRLAILIILLSSIFGSSMPNAQAQGATLSDIEHFLFDAITGALSSNPYKISLLDLSYDSNLLTLNLSDEARNISQSDFETLFHAIDLAAYRVLEEQNLTNGLNLDYLIQVNGKPLTDMFPPVEDDHVLPESVDGKKISLSPGHGWYDTGSGWALQRVYYYGIVEDFINANIIMAVTDKFTGYNVTLKPTREINASAGNHGSGHPWWQMDASEYAKSQGAPSSVWGTLSGMDRDIMARPYYANWVGANTLVSLHNNGGGGCGTETWYDTGNGYQTASQQLAQAIQSKLITRLRAQWNSNWCDRGVKGSNGGYGENHFFHGPAVIIELGFMDNQSDNAALQNATFRDIVATAIRDAIVEYFGGGGILVPPVPTGISASDGTYSNKIQVAWNASSGATSYEVWRNTSNTTSGAVKFATLSAGPYDDTSTLSSINYYYWIKACNTNGCSAFSSSDSGYWGPNGVVIVNPPILDPLPGDCTKWWQPFSGFNGVNAYLTLNTNQESQSTNSAIWTPNLPVAGVYKVEEFVAYHDANISVCGMTKPGDTSDAHFTIYHANGTTNVSGNQLPLNNEWLNLGNFTFNAGTAGKVYLTDLNHESNLSHFISFSAVRFTLISAQQPTPTFTDVPLTYWAYGFIEHLYNNGITGGCSTSPLMYCPDSTVTRAQMAVFLLVAKHGAGYTAPAATGIFNDVPASNGFAKWIEAMATEGITGGCGGGNYCPNQAVTREQMAVFLLVAEHGTGYTPPAATGVFTDVPASNPFAPWIEQLAAEGITGGCGGGKFCPKGTVTRAQMAVFLVSAFNLP